MSSFTRHVFFCLRSNVFSCLAVGGLVLLATLTVAGPALAPYDALHDAVIIDGVALFYIIRDGLAFPLD